MKLVQIALTAVAGLTVAFNVAPQQAQAGEYVKVKADSIVVNKDVPDFSTVTARIGHQSKDGKFYVEVGGGTTVTKFDDKGLLVAEVGANFDLTKTLTLETKAESLLFMDSEGLHQFRLEAVLKQML